MMSVKLKNAVSGTGFGSFYTAIKDRSVKPSDTVIVEFDDVHIPNSVGDAAYLSSTRVSINPMGGKPEDVIGNRSWRVQL